MTARPCADCGVTHAETAVCVASLDPPPAEALVAEVEMACQASPFFRSDLPLPEAVRMLVGDLHHMLEVLGGELGAARTSAYRYRERALDLERRLAEREEP